MVKNVEIFNKEEGIEKLVGQMSRNIDEKTNGKYTMAFDVNFNTLEICNLNKATVVDLKSILKDNAECIFFVSYVNDTTTL